MLLTISSFQIVAPIPDSWFGKKTFQRHVFRVKRTIINGYQNMCVSLNFSGKSFISLRAPPVKVFSLFVLLSKVLHRPVRTCQTYYHTLPRHSAPFTALEITLRIFIIRFKIPSIVERSRGKDLQLSFFHGFFLNRRSRAHEFTVRNRFDCVPSRKHSVVSSWNSSTFLLTLVVYLHEPRVEKFFHYVAN